MNPLKIQWQGCWFVPRCPPSVPELGITVVLLQKERKYTSSLHLTHSPLAQGYLRVAIDRGVNALPTELSPPLFMLKIRGFRLLADRDISAHLFDIIFSFISRVFLCYELSKFIAIVLEAIDFFFLPFLIDLSYKVLMT